MSNQVLDFPFHGASHFIRLHARCFHQQQFVIHGNKDKAGLEAFEVMIPHQLFKGSSATFSTGGASFLAQDQLRGISGVDDMGKGKLFRGGVETDHAGLSLSFIKNL
jgi:hypothetical protein